MPAQRNKRKGAKGRKSRSSSHPYSETSKKRKIRKTPNKTPGTQPTNANDVAQPVALGVKTPLERFFSRYPKFKYQPRNSSVTEFSRLCKEYGWKKDGPKKDPAQDAARHEFSLAMGKEFDSLYGSDEKDINNWHKLCYILSIDPVPDTLHECRAAVFKKHVNLVDLVERSRENIQIFESEIKLSEYTRETKKFFPKENAANGGVLRALRRHILAPRSSRRLSRAAASKV